jgi:hypothetical protein
MKRSKPDYYDHEIVRALETHPKTIPWNMRIEFCVIMGLQV